MLIAKKLRQKEIITRKDDNCWGCKKFLPKGTEVVLAVSKYNKEFINAKWCQECLLKMADIPFELYPVDGIAYGEFITIEKQFRKQSKQRKKQ